MPSGVEHPMIALSVSMVMILIAASMPSGVEHRSPALTQRFTVPSDRRLDAFGR